MAGILRATAVRRGVFGGSRGWTLLWALLLGIRLVKRLARRNDVVYREALEPGTRLLISSEPPG